MINTNDCWLFAGAKDKKGYGHLWADKKHYKAYRAMYEAFNGIIPKGLELDHLCRVPDCINPAHLEAVTHRENTLRGTGLTAQFAKRTHCINGHEFNAKNTRVEGNVRRCRACQNEARKRYVLRKHD